MSQVGDHLSAIPRALAVLGLPGMILLMWTVVVCVAFLNGNEAFIQDHAMKLFCTWWTMASVWGIWTVAVGFFTRHAIQKRVDTELSPRAVSIGHPPTENAPGSEPTA